MGRRADEVVTPAVSNLWRRREGKEVADALKKLNLSKNFVLAVSTLEPRKNYRTLINAFVSLRRSGELSNYELVIVGGKGWKCEDDVKLIRASQNEGVRWVGFVADEDLQCLYSAASLYISASSYEGFGIPALEAVSCGTRALLADLPELREAGGNEAHYLEVTEHNLKSKMLELLSTPALPARATRPTTRPTWSAGATTMKKLFYAALEGEHP
jgi:glycosyltransferase involved in cell wall biosynthesis